MDIQAAIEKKRAGMEKQKEYKAYLNAKAEELAKLLEGETIKTAERILHLADEKVRARAVILED